MIILLDETETVDLAQVAIQELAHDPNKFDRVKKGLFYQTKVDHEELKLLVEVYIMD